MTQWRLLITPPAHGAWNMAVDESILLHIGGGNSPPTLRLYSWTPACLSIGYAQPFADVDQQSLQDHGWDVVRRPTGGRAILHTDELTYSVIVSGDEPRVAGTVLESYNRLSQALLLAVHKLNLPVEMKERRNGRIADLNPICFEVPSSYEIMVNGRKLIGSAQARRKEGVLQHGSLPLTGDITRIGQALVFENDPAREEAMKRLRLRATTVESALGRVISWDLAAQAFIEAFEVQFGLKFERAELSGPETLTANQLVNEKYNHPFWTKRV